MDPYGGPGGPGGPGAGAGPWGHPGHGPHWGGLPPGMPLGSMPSGMSCSMSGSIPSGMHCLGAMGGLGGMAQHLPAGGLGQGLGQGLGLGMPGPATFMGSMPSVHAAMSLHGPLPHLVETYRNSCPVHSPYRFHFANGGPSFFSQQVSE